MTGAAADPEIGPDIEDIIPNELNAERKPDSYCYSDRWGWTNIYFLGFLAFLMLTTSVLLIIGFQGATEAGEPGSRDGTSLITVSEEPMRNAGMECSNPAEEATGKDARTALLLCVFFGAFGAHRFYYGYPETGAVLSLLSVLTAVAITGLSLSLSLKRKQDPDSGLTGLFSQHWAKGGILLFFSVAGILTCLALWLTEMIGIIRNDVVPDRTCYISL